MTDIDEKEIADQIDREVAAAGELLSLVLCLAGVAGLVVVGVAAMISAV
jgi:hypothetical protein